MKSHIAIGIAFVLMLSACVPIPAEPVPPPDSAGEAGLRDLASVFAEADPQTDVTEYVDVLLSIRDCIRNDLGGFAVLGLETEAGHTGYVAYMVGVLMSTVMYLRHMAVESGELNAYFPDGESREDHYGLTHLKWVLAYCEDSEEYEWLKTE